MESKEFKKWRSQTFRSLLWCAFLHLKKNNNTYFSSHKFEYLGFALATVKLVIQISVLFFF